MYIKTPQIFPHKLFFFLKPNARVPELRGNAFIVMSIVMSARHYYFLAIVTSFL